MKNKKQFTLIELIIVIVVIGILAGMALPKFNGVVRNAKLAAMINDKEVLEKTLIMYYQKNDTLPLLNEDEELIIANEGISLTKIVLAEEAKNSDMDTIYNSLKETLSYYNDSEETLYRIDLPKIKDSLSKNIKYGHKKTDKDFYVYSVKTGNVYYYDFIVNGNGTIQHTEYDTLLKDSELTNKERSFYLNSDGIPTNNKPIVNLTTDLDNITTDSVINWTYKFIDEDKTPTKISFILNNVEYDSFDKIPTKLGSGDYTIKLKMQDSTGLWSDEKLINFKVYEIKTLFSKKNISALSTLRIRSGKTYETPHHDSRSGYIQDDLGRKIVRIEGRFTGAYNKIEGKEVPTDYSDEQTVEISPPKEKVHYSVSSTDFGSAAIYVYYLTVIESEGWVDNQIISQDITLDSTDIKFVLSTIEDLPEGSTLKYYIVDKESGVETLINKDEVTNIKTNSTKICIKIIGTKGLNDKLPSIGTLELKSIK